MSDIMTTIRLYGKMGAKFGRVHRVCLGQRTPAQAVNWLCSQFPEAKSYFMGAEKDGVRFAVFRGKENIGKGQLSEPSGRDDIRIAPVLAGSKRGGTLQVILGVALIVVGAFFAPETGGLSTQLIGTGATMVAGGLIQMLSPPPKLQTGDSADNKPSYIFQGAVNTQAQGNPVPLLYGRMICGSAVISAAIKSQFYQPSGGVGSGNPRRATDDPVLGWNPRNPYQRYVVR